MKFAPVATFLESLGIRKFYGLVSTVASDAMLDRHRKPELNFFDLKELRDNSRYFAWANLLRGGFYVPVILVLIGLKSWFAVGALVFLVTFHGVCILLEIYRNILANHWLGKMETEGLEEAVIESKDKPKREVADSHLYFDPKPLESVELYRAIGVEHFRRVVVWYTNVTKFTKEERASGKRVQYVQGDRQSLIKFDYDTRVGELMHLAAWAFNLPPFAAFLLAKLNFWIGYVGVILLLDTYLVLLQRYNRFRVLRLLARQNRGRSAPVPTPERVEA